MRRSVRIATVTLGAVIFAWAVFSAGFFTGNVAAVRGVQPLAQFAGVPAASPPAEVGDIDFGIFWEAWNAIQDNFYRGPLDPGDLREGAINGMAEATDDPHTRFQNQADARRARDQLQGSFDGVGIRITFKDDLPFILQPIAGSPAEKAGVGTNEFVLAVDGVSTESMTLADFGERVRGPRGTTVVLTLRPEGSEIARDVEIVRSRILVPSVRSRRIEDLGYVRITSFTSRTIDELSDSLDGFREDGIAGLIIDLRNNPGGLLDASVKVSAQFLADGSLIVAQESRDEPRTEWRVGQDTGDTDTPMAVLMNGGSASASEIVAGALQAHQRAELIGEATFGKGSVQELHRLSDDSLIRITSGIWITPAGVNLSGEGLFPDIPIEAGDADLGSDDDPVLQAAVRLLHGEDPVVQPAIEPRNRPAA